jgi:FkbM family methyltransferase
MTPLRRFSLSEVLIVAILVAAATAIVMTRLSVTPAAAAARSAPGERVDVARGEQTFFLSRSRQELAPIERRYGPDHFSRYVEEWVARDYFHDRRGGVFLDVGAGHYRNESNTYYLETELGWSGVAVDALPEYEADYRAHRPRTKFVAMFASDVDGSSVRLFEPAHLKRLASASEAFTVKKGERGDGREVPTATLRRVLEEARVAKVDYLSMDIELAEPKALAGFDIGKYQPELVCIEMHPEVRQQIFDYFARNGYVVEGRYLRIDPTNVYFKPLR